MNLTLIMAALTGYAGLRHLGRLTVDALLNKTPKVRRPNAGVTLR